MRSGWDNLGVCVTDTNVLLKREGNLVISKLLVVAGCRVQDILALTTPTKGGLPHMLFHPPPLSLWSSRISCLPTSFLCQETLPFGVAVGCGGWVGVRSKRRLRVGV